MRRWILRSLFPVVGRIPFFLRRRGKVKTPEESGEDGGVRDTTSKDAPKTIASRQIVSFECRFSTMDLEGDGPLGNHVYSLQARLENGAVKGRFQRLDTGETRLFRAGHRFLSQVRDLIVAYDLAQYNGHCRKVSGLPGDYGVRLKVRYASGESIYASDNQDNFLSDGAMQELVTLFLRGVPVA